MAESNTQEELSAEDFKAEVERFAKDAYNIGVDDCLKYIERAVAGLLPYTLVNDQAKDWSYAYIQLSAHLVRLKK